MEVIGIDIGGSGIKGAVVDTETGEFLTERFRVETPQPATPDAVVKTVAEVIAHLDRPGLPIGVGLPAVVKKGVAYTAANIDEHWIGTNAETAIQQATGSPLVRVANDADVAGLAEMRFGAGKGVNGLVLMITLGTGIGTALFLNGALVPNTELGHVRIPHHGEAEQWASDAARERDDLKWGEWAERVQDCFRTLENLLWPDLILVGGGVSKRADKWLPHVQTRTPVVIATLKNDAGIVGAALLTSEGSG